MATAHDRLKAALTAPGVCDLAVVDSTFTQVSIASRIEEGGEVTLGLPWSLDFPEAGARILVLSWASFGMNGVN